MEQRRCRWTVRALQILTLSLWSITACTQPPSAAPEATAVGEGGWLAGTVDQKLDTVAKQLRGFDMAMVETGYRYNELYWAAREGNWGFADYQIKKIRTAIENGLERRPKRAASAQKFLTIILPAIEGAIARQDSATFRDQFGALTSGCNDCHASEKVDFVRIAEPRVRLTAVRWP